MHCRSPFARSPLYVLLACLCVTGADRAHAQESLAISSPTVPIVFVDPPPPAPADASRPRPPLTLGSRKAWTAADKRIVTDVFRQIGLKAPGLLQRATAYRRLTLYRGDFPAGEFAAAFAQSGSSNSVTFGNLFFAATAPVGILVHELTHLDDYGALDAGSAEWKQLVDPRCQRIHDTVLAERGFRLTYALSEMQWDDVQHTYMALAHEQGLPTVYACVNLPDALAETVSAVFTGDRARAAPALAAFAEQRYLSPNYVAQPRFKDYFDAIALVEAGKSDEAIAATTRLLAAQDDFIDLYSLRAMGRVAKGDVNGALTDLDKNVEALLQVHDGYNAAMVSAARAEILITARRFDEAVAAYSKSIEYLPGWIDFLFARATLRADNVNDPAGAIADCTEALRLRRESLPTVLLRAKAFGMNKAYAQQDADFRTAIGLDPEFAETYFDRASSRMARGMFADAIADFTTVMDLENKKSAPDYWFRDKALFMRGQAHENAGELREAIADYTAVIDLAKRWAAQPVIEYHQARGIAEVKAGDFLQGIGDVRIAQRDPARTAELQPWIDKGYSLAVASFRQAADRGDPAAENSLGCAYRDGTGVRQDPAQALTWFLKSAEHGLAGGQVNAAVLYATANGVPKDLVAADMWMRIARQKGDANALKNVDILEQGMTAEQIAAAQQRASAWLQAHR